jgi:hypothetical protein
MKRGHAGTPDNFWEAWEFNGTTSRPMTTHLLPQDDTWKEEGLPYFADGTR